MNVPVTRPSFSDDEAAAVAKVLASGWVSQGPRVAEFEEAFARYTGAPHAVAVCSCTAGLHLSLVAAGIGPGDEVVLPSFTFVATANAVEYCGARPVFADVDPRTFNADPHALAAAITPRTRAVIAVHLFGLMADMDAIMTLARRHGLTVVEDAACAVGASAGGRHAGTIGPFGAFSFHPRKVVTTGEGGMVTTQDAAIAERLRSLRSHAATISDLDRHARRGFVLPRFREVGFNYRMTDLQAAVGIVQLGKVEAMLARRQGRVDAYMAALADVPGLALPVVPPGYVHGFQSFVATVTGDARLTRDDLAERLEAEGIATRQGTHAVHALDYYRDRYGLKPEDCPASLMADRGTLTLPLYADMTDEEQARVDERLRAHLCG